MSVRPLRHAVIIALLLVAAPARADGERPWADGVSQAEQDIALAIYQRGNTEFAEQRFSQAIVLYAEALTHWNHPAIHFNIAVSLLNLDRLIEADEHLDASLAYGPPGLGADSYAQALTYRKLLDNQLSRARISCQEPGARVSLDGQLLFVGPGSATKRLLPGDHQIVASKDGFVTQSETVTFTAGKVATHDIRLVAFKSLPPAVATSRRFPVWLPWTVAGVGVAALGAGAILHAIAADNLDEYDDRVAAACSNRVCTDTDLAGLESLRARAHTQNTVALSLLVGGGAVAAAGILGVVFNAPRFVEVTPVTGGATVGTSWQF